MSVGIKKGETVNSTVLHLAALEKFHTALYTSGKHRGCQQLRGKTYRLSSVMKKTAPFLQRGPCPRQTIPYQDNLSYLSQWKGRCSPLTAYTQACKVICQRHNVYRHESWPFSLMCLTWHLTQPWLPDGGLKRTPVFILGNHLWITHSVSFQKDLIHCPLRSLR